MNFWPSSIISSFVASSLTALLNRANERRKCRPFIDAQLVYKSELGNEVGIAKLKNWNSKEIPEILDDRYFLEPYYLKVENLSNFPCYQVECEMVVHNLFGKESNNKIEYRIPKLEANNAIYVNVLREIMLKEQVDTESMVYDFNTKKKSKLDVGCFVYSNLINISDLVKEIENCKHDMKNIVYVYQELKPAVNDKDLYKFKKLNFNFRSEQFEKLSYKFAPYDGNEVKIGSLDWKNKRYISSLFGK